MTLLHGFILHHILYLPELYVYQSAILEEFFTTRVIVQITLVQFKFKFLYIIYIFIFLILSSLPVILYWLCWCFFILVTDQYQSIYILIDWPVFSSINKLIIIVIIVIIIRSLVDFSFQRFLRSHFCTPPSKFKDKPIMLVENFVVVH